MRAELHSRASGAMAMAHTAHAPSHGNGHVDVWRLLKMAQERLHHLKLLVQWWMIKGCKTRIATLRTGEEVTIRHPPRVGGGTKWEATNGDYIDSWRISGLEDIGSWGYEPK